MLSVFFFCSGNMNIRENDTIIAWTMSCMLALLVKLLEDIRLEETFSDKAGHWTWIALWRSLTRFEGHLLLFFLNLFFLSIKVTFIRTMTATNNRSPNRRIDWKSVRVTTLLRQRFCWRFASDKKRKIQTQTHTRIQSERSLLVNSHVHVWCPRTMLHLYEFTGEKITRRKEPNNHSG